MNLGTKEIVAFGAPYLVAVGACYLFGYWGAFQINVLEYISIADVAKLAIYPLMASLVFALAGVAFSELVHSPHFPPGGGNDTPVGRLGLKHWRLLLGLQIVVTVLVATYAPEPGKWFVVALLVSLFSTALAHIEKVIELLPNPRVRSTVLFLSLFLPTMGFAYGRQQAYLVKTGVIDHFVDVERSKLPFTADAKSQVAYLGLLGNIYVLREGKKGYIIFVKQRDDSPLFLVPKQ
jgi:hypothetical protein